MRGMNGLIGRCPVCGATEMHECGRGQYVCEVCGRISYQQELEYGSAEEAARINESDVRDLEIHGAITISEAVSSVTARYFYE